MSRKKTGTRTGLSLLVGLGRGEGGRIRGGQRDGDLGKVALLEEVDFACVVEVEERDECVDLVLLCVRGHQLGEEDVTLGLLEVPVDSLVELGDDAVELELASGRLE